MRNYIKILITFFTVGIGITFSCSNHQTPNNLGTVNKFLSETKEKYKEEIEYQKIFELSKKLYDTRAEFYFKPTIDSINENQDGSLSEILNHKEDMINVIISDVPNDLKFYTFQNLLRKRLLSRPEAIQLYEENLDESVLPSEIVENVSFSINLLPNITLGDTITKITLYNGSEELASEEVKRLIGKNHLIFFYEKSCNNSIPYSDVLNSLAHKYDDSVLEIIGISLDNSRQSFIDFKEKRNLKFKCYSDHKGWETKNTLDFGVEYLPQIYLLDKQGRIIMQELEHVFLNRFISTIIDN